MNASFVIASAFIYSMVAHSAFADSQLWQDKPQQEVADVVQKMFNALSAGKAAQYETLVTPDFYLYDMGERLSRDAFADVIQKGVAKGMKYEWKITAAEAHISGNLAWITYTNRGSFDTGKGKQQRVWLESAVLERYGKTWRIRFLHSTLAAKEPIARHLSPHCPALGSGYLNLALAN